MEETFKIISVAILFTSALTALIFVVMDQYSEKHKNFCKENSQNFVYTPYSQVRDELDQDIEEKFGRNSFKNSFRQNLPTDIFGIPSNSPLLKVIMSEEIDGDKFSDTGSERALISEESEKLGGSAGTPANLKGLSKVIGGDLKKADFGMLLNKFLGLVNRITTCILFLVILQLAAFYWIDNSLVDSRIADAENSKICENVFKSDNSTDLSLCPEALDSRDIFMGKGFEMSTER